MYHTNTKTRIYNKVCPRCLKEHLTTAKSSKAICDYCNKSKNPK